MFFGRLLFLQLLNAFSTARHIGYFYNVSYIFRLGNVHHTTHYSVQWVEYITFVKYDSVRMVDFHVIFNAVADVFNFFFYFVLCSAVIDRRGEINTSG